MIGTFYYQLLFLIIICFSFLIAVFTYCLNKQPSLLKLIASTFIIPLGSLVFYYLYPIKAISPLITVAGCTTLIIISLFLMINPKTELHSLLQIVPVLLTIFIILLFIHPVAFIIKPNFMPPLLAIAALLVMLSIYVGSKNKTQHKMLSIGLLLLLAFLLLHSQAKVNWMEIFSVIILFTAYICLFIYFYNESYGKLMQKIVEADEKLSNWERAVMNEVRKRTYEIERSNFKLLDIAKLDALTQVYNKVNIINIISLLTEDRQQRPFTILMFDIDNFKNINDTRGHVTGDMVIKQITNISRSCVRDIDSVGRYGGDEFLIVLPHTNVTDAYFVAERLRRKVEADPICDCTLSIGIASFPKDGTSSKALIQVADQGLYLSKQKGRNTITYLNDPT